MRVGATGSARLLIIAEPKCDSRGSPVWNEPLRLVSEQRRRSARNSYERQDARDHLHGRPGRRRFTMIGSLQVTQYRERPYLNRISSAGSATEPAGCDLTGGVILKIRLGLSTGIMCGRPAYGRYFILYLERSVLQHPLVSVRGPNEAVAAPKGGAHIADVEYPTCQKCA